MSMEDRIGDELFTALQEERRWVTSDILDAARVGAAAVVGLLRQGSPEIRWCKEHNQATYEDDDPKFCAYGEARWESLTCEVSPAWVLLGDAGSQGEPA